MVPSGSGFREVQPVSSHKTLSLEELFDLMVCYSGLKFLIIDEQGAPHFHFFLGSASYVVCRPVPKHYPVSVCCALHELFYLHGIPFLGSPSHVLFVVFPT